DTARAVSGFDGTGQTVGVLSDSYDRDVTAITHEAQDVANGDLPGDVHVLVDDNPNGRDEGRAMLQVIHDVAPGATLAFATASGGQATFAQHIRDLANAGARVIVDDVSRFDEPFFQDSIIAQAVDEVVSHGVAYFTAAGNEARQSYESDWHTTRT